MVDGSPPWRYTFTVFTATFNRATTLSRPYESLRAQSFRDFEWLIVDDGSTDGTENLVRRWQQDADFPIRYLYQENRGKHAALNRGVAEARGYFFLPLDSDDACVPQALERFKYHWDAIGLKQQATFSAVTALCVDQYGRQVGERFPRDPTDSDSLEVRYKFKVEGEKWGFHRVDVLRRFPFPDPALGHVPEGLVWRAIAREFKTRFVNEALRIYWIAEDSQTEQLTRTDSYAKAAPGDLLWCQSVLNEDLDWFRSAPLTFLREAAYLSRFSFHAGQTLRQQMNGLTNPFARLLWVAMIPFGFLAYEIDRRRTRGRRATEA